MVDADKTKTIQQFWYTWSEFGYGELHGGYRIRAVSEDLKNINSERVRTLDKYARYSLPDQTDLYDPILERGKAYYTLGLSPDIRPYSSLLDIEGASISFAFVDTEPHDLRLSERILVNKVYIGKDKLGRPGTFFVHILAGLPQEFTVKDAVALWRSNIWQTADPPPQIAGLVIEAKSLYELQTDRWVSRTAWQNVHDQNLDDYLQFVVHAYLQQQDEEDERWQRLRAKKAELDQLQNKRRTLSARKEIAQHDKLIVAEEAEYQKLRQKGPRRIYIAAKADWVIYFVAKLAQVLPPELLEYLTFSTYEYEPQKSQSLIVGTCMPPASQPTNARSREILPSIAYAYEHALNCYAQSVTPERQSVKYAEDFAQFAVDALTEEPELIEELLKEVEESKASGTVINVKSFLEIYYRWRYRRPLTKEEAEKIYRERGRAYDLKREWVCGEICELIVGDPEWFEQQLKPLVIARVASSYNDKQLAEQILPVPRKNLVSIMTKCAEDPDKTNELKYRRFMSYFGYLQALSPVRSDPKTWASLLERLLSAEQPRQFVLQYAELRTRLVVIGASIFPETDERRSKLVSPLLAVPLTSFYDFHHKLRESNQGDLAPDLSRAMILEQLRAIKK